MRHVLESYRKAADIVHELNAFAEAGQSQIQQMAGEGRELEKPLRDGTFERDTPEFAECEKKCLQLESSINRKKSTTEREVKQRNTKAKLAIFQDVSEAIRRRRDAQAIRLWACRRSRRARARRPRPVRAES